MTLEINDSKTVQEIQEEFSNRFPYLKLEFFTAPHQPEEPSNEMPCPPERTIGEIREHHVYGIIDITPDRETAALEQEFMRRFNLHVQVYRLQMGHWVQSSATDMLTLQEQTELARDSEFFYNPNHQVTEEDI